MGLECPWLAGDHLGGYGEVGGSMVQWHPIRGTFWEDSDGSQINRCDRYRDSSYARG